jgi:hypothetical protein
MLPAHRSCHAHARTITMGALSFSRNGSRSTFHRHRCSASVAPTRHDVAHVSSGEEHRCCARLHEEERDVADLWLHDNFKAIGRRSSWELPTALRTH